MSDFSVKDMNQRMAQMQQSPEYQASCQRFSQECARLEAIATDLLTHKEELLAHCGANTVRTEYASGSTLHRGFYCPSPTYDIIVGNTKRGKLLKHPTILSNPSHEYGFDADGRLLYCKRLYKRSVTMTEYFVYRKNLVYGILLDADGDISVITEETYTDGKITQYLHGLCVPSGDHFHCMEINCEEYEYDAGGLLRCHMHNLLLPQQNPPEFLKEVMLPFMWQPIYRSDSYLFERSGGYLSSYTCRQHTYRVHARRKA